MFEWQTEDETGWEGEGFPRQTAEPVRRKLPWLMWVVGITAVLLLLGMIYRQVQTEVAERTTAVEQELLAAHRFVWDVATRQEQDLFRAQLSGRDPRWMQDQMELVEANLFLHRPVMGLTAVLPFTSHILTTTLNPELTAGEVTAVYTYTVLNAAGVSETVQLQQTAVYRLGQDRRWLLAPPLELFWGDWKSEETPYLTLIYPQRDAAIAAQLAHDLNNLLRRACHELADLECPEAAHLQVRFSEQPENLLKTADDAPWAQPEYALELPTPTLVGLPIDEASYQALYRAYGRQVLSAFISRVVGYSCCSHLPFFQALLQPQLHQLGLWAAPLTPAAYEQVVRAYNTRAGEQAWRQANLHLSDLEWLQLQTIVVYVLETADTTPARLQYALSATDSYLDWLLIFFPDVDNITYLDTHIQQFAYLRSTTGSQSPPLPLPHQRIALSCHNDEAITLHEYDLTTEQWTQVFSRETQGSGYYGAALPLPDGSGYALQEAWDVDGEQYGRILLWRPEEEVTVIEKSWLGYGTLYLTNWWGNYPENHWLFTVSNSDGSEYEIWVFDPSECHAGQCEVKQVMGWPIWSPDETNTLLLVPQENGEGLYDIYHGDAWGQLVQQVGQGAGSYWLNDQQYVYFSQTGQVLGQWVWADVQDDVPHPLFTPEELLLAIPAEERPLSLTVQYLIPRPGVSQLVIVAEAEEGGGNRGFYFLWQAEEITLLQQVDTLDWGTSFSPNGRWLYVGRNNRYGTLSSVELYDQDNQKRVSLDVDQFFWPSWSADDEWMAYHSPDENVIHLYAPAHDYHRLIPYTMSNCFNYPLWLEAED